MRNFIVALTLGAFLLALTGVASPQQKDAELPPPWAYGFTTPLAPGTPPAPPALPAIATAAPDPTVRHVPGSDLGFTFAQIHDPYGPADWFPNEHAPVPDIVAHGHKPEVFSCGLCHYINGRGRPENTGIAGLPADYFIQTMNDFKNGNRRTADPRKENTARMAGYAKAMSDDEIKAAAAYFGSIKWVQWIKVVETDTVPKTRNTVGMFVALPGNEKEPIGQRIVEVPVDGDRTDVLHDEHSGFIAYAPIGSVAKGQALVMNGANGKTTPCGVCHGADLQGLGAVPGIAGRSPSYIARQIFDMKQGARNGVWTALMKPVVEKLNDDDILAIAAYLASRPIN